MQIYFANFLMAFMLHAFIKFFPVFEIVEGDNGQRLYVQYTSGNSGHLLRFFIRSYPNTKRLAYCKVIFMSPSSTDLMTFVSQFALN